MSLPATESSTSSTTCSCRWAELGSNDPPARWGRPRRVGPSSRICGCRTPLRPPARQTRTLCYCLADAILPTLQAPRTAAIGDTVDAFEDPPSVRPAPRPPVMHNLKRPVVDPHLRRGRQAPRRGRRAPENANAVIPQRTRNDYNGTAQAAHCIVPGTKGLSRRLSVVAFGAVGQQTRPNGLPEVERWLSVAAGMGRARVSLIRLPDTVHVRLASTHYGHGV
jgi:hypothetical protein